MGASRPKPFFFFFFFLNEIMARICDATDVNLLLTFLTNHHHQMILKVIAFSLDLISNRVAST